MFVVSTHNQVAAQALTSGKLPPRTTKRRPVLDQSHGGGKVFLDDKGRAMEGEDVPTCITCHKASTNDTVLTHDFQM